LTIDAKRVGSLKGARMKREVKRKRMRMESRRRCLGRARMTVRSSDGLMNHGIVY